MSCVLLSPLILLWRIRPRRILWLVERLIEEEILDNSPYARVLVPRILVFDLGGRRRPRRGGQGEGQRGRHLFSSFSLSSLVSRLSSLVL